MSFPSRERGLKFIRQMHISQRLCRSPRGNVDWNSGALEKAYETGIVVPLAGTWIEIPRQLLLPGSGSSFPSRERGLKCQKWVALSFRYCRSPRGNVDWNQFMSSFVNFTNSRSPRGNVDWNRSIGSIYWWQWVVPLAGTWIEISKIFSSTFITLSFPSRERGLK